MNVIRHTPYAIRLTADVAGDGREIGVKFGARVGLEEWVTIFRAEDDVDDDERE